MFGKIDPVEFAILSISTIAFITDLVKGRIYNWTTIPAIGIGIAASTYLHGGNGLMQALGGIVLALVMYGWMFWLGVMGGGDVKFLMALGAWAGIQYVIEVGLLAVLLGGVMAVFLLFFKGRLKGFVKKMYYFMLSLFIKELEFQFPEVDKKLKMPFGLSIAVAAVWTIHSHPLLKWGLPRWF